MQKNKVPKLRFTLKCCAKVKQCYLSVTYVKVNISNAKVNKIVPDAKCKFNALNKPNLFLYTDILMRNVDF